MRAVTVAIGLVVLSAMAFFVGDARPARGTSEPAESGVAKNAPQEKPFVVHEWGTFTSFSGSDGVKLEFRPLVDNDLPQFVHDRWSQAGIGNPAGKGLISARQRMETPVTYFYTDTIRDVRVKVGFPNGLLTEFYPPVQSMMPEVKAAGAPAIGQSSLDWGTVTLIPADLLKTQIPESPLADEVNRRVLNRLVPQSIAPNHYTLARATDSALVRVTRAPIKNKPNAPSGDFYERYLFYRGVGNFSLPLTLTSASQGRFELTNSGVDDIQGLFLVRVADGHVHFAQYDRVAAGQKLEMQQPESSGSIDELAEAVTIALVAQGLYPKEASAMVNTWRTSWFGEDGMRLFYFLPNAATDAILPLTIEPKPDETVRVMVGRMEIMTPEEETRITDMVIRSQSDRPARQATAKRQMLAAPEEIAKLGRLAEPALVRVKEISTDPALKYEAMQLLRELHSAWGVSPAGQ